MANRLIYKDKESRDYGRFFATTTVLGGNPSDNLVMDFYEEYISSPMIMEVNFQNDESTYSHDAEDIVVIREKKVSVLMTRNAAVALARRILERYENEEDET